MAVQSTYNYLDNYTFNQLRDCINNVGESLYANDSEVNCTAEVCELNQLVGYENNPDILVGSNDPTNVGDGIRAYNITCTIPTGYNILIANSKLHLAEYLGKIVNPDCNMLHIRVINIKEGNGMELHLDNSSMYIMGHDSIHFSACECEPRGHWHKDTTVSPPKHIDVLYFLVTFPENCTVRSLLILKNHFKPHSFLKNTNTQ